MTDTDTPKLTPTQRLEKRAEEQHEQLMAALTRPQLEKRESLDIDRKNGSVDFHYGAVREADESALEFAERVMQIEAILSDRYPATPPLPEVDLTRNAKGETQIKVSGDKVRAAETYSELRARFRLADGTVGHGEEKDE